MKTIILPDGKLSVPAELREALGLTPGTVLEIKSESGKIVAWKKSEAQSGEPFTFSLPGGSVTSENVRAVLEDEDE